MTAYTFERALDIANDWTDDQILEMARDLTPFELADRVAAKSGHTFLRDIDAEDWLFHMRGPCRNHGDRPGVCDDHQGRPVCRSCSAGAAALGLEDPA